jgi:hypothetical protein
MFYQIKTNLTFKRKFFIGNNMSMISKFSKFLLGCSLITVLSMSMAYAEEDDMKSNETKTSESKAENPKHQKGKHDKTKVDEEKETQDEKKNS